MGLIPKKKTIPKQKLSECQKLYFGEAGSGKTSLAAEEPDTLMVLFEDGIAGLSVYAVNVVEEARKTNKMVWEVFTDLVDEILEGDHNFSNIAIDTVDRAYPFAQDYVCQKNGWSHPSEGSYGAGWAALNNAFQEPIKKLEMSKYGLTLLSHAQFKEVADIKGNKRDKIIPSTGGQSGQWIIDECDFIVFLDRDEESNRVLRVESDKNFEAKNRITFEKKVIPAGNSPKEAYKNFKKEFEKAVKNRNKELGITDEMVKNYYAEKDEEEKLVNAIEEIKQLCQSKSITLMQHRKLMENEFGFSEMSDERFDLSKAEQYKKVVESQ